MNKSTWKVYILQCADGTYYTGITTHLDHRLRAHNAGTGAKYTRARRPVSCVYQENASNRSTASQREYALKQLSRAEKTRLISTYTPPLPQAAD